MSNKDLGLNELCALITEELKSGKITEAEWYSKKKAATSQSYTSKKTPVQQCGHTGNEETWTYSRIMPLLETLYKSGSFIDIGCAIGYINESLHKWTKNSPIDIVYYGVDICEDLIKIAKERMVEFKENYYVGNLDSFIPPIKFDYVRTFTLGFVPEYKRKKLAKNLYDNYVKDGGRLILGPYTEPKDKSDLREYFESLGYIPSGYIKKSYGNNERKLMWYDKK